MNVTGTNISYEAYLDGKRLLGTAEITHPSIQAMTQEIKGAGITGTVDLPILGHIQNLEGTITFRNITDDVRKLLSQKTHHIEFWAAVETVDTATGQLVPKQHKIIWKAMPKADTVGKHSVGELQNRELGFTITYYKEMYDNDLVQEIDKFNYIFNVGGEDLLANVRKLLGL
jgi:P2 family phage contractile tail tube protein